MAPLIAMLMKAGLPLIADAVIAKGKQVVEEKLGIELKPEMTAAEIQIAKDKQQEHERFLIDAAQRSYETEVADRNKARDMQMAALGQDDLFSKRFLYYYASVLTTVCLLYIFMITFVTIPAANVRFADTILGFLLGTVLSTIIFFFFGSSRNNQKKDEIINKLTNKDKE